MSLLRRAVTGVEARAQIGSALPWGDTTPPSPSQVGTNVAGIGITSASSVQVAAVYGCVSLIADSVSSLPLRLLNGPNPALAKALPPSTLMQRPFVETNIIDWLGQFIWSFALRGNFYGEIIERDPRTLYPVQIKPWDPDRVRVRRTQQGKVEYSFGGKVVDNDNVFHVKNQSFPGAIVGLNPIQICAVQFGLALAMESYALSFFSNSANPQGVIEVPGDLDRTETRKMLRSWLAAHGGISKANLPAILTGGAKFNPITISPEDSQLLGALDFTEQQICGRIFRVPPHMIGIVEKETSFGKGIEQQERNFFTNTLVGYLTKIGLALTEQHPAGQYVSFDISSREQGATLERAQAASLLMNAGVGRADDLRPWFGWAPLPNGDGEQSFIPTNTQLLEQALQVLTDAGSANEMVAVQERALDDPEREKAAARLLLRQLFGGDQ